jgi:prepilin-type processing-associated H-X9-DG protein
MKKTRIPLRNAAFSLLELLIVTGIIIILLGFIMIAVGGGVRFADSMKCMKTASSISNGIVLFAEANNGELPWAGGADRNMHKDWVWGGQGKTQTRDTAEWNNPSASFGHHAEAGAAFPYITGLKIHRRAGVKYGGDSSGEAQFDPRDFDYDNDGDKAYGLIDESHKTIYKEYRCPNSGEYEQLAKALRVNYSLNAWIDNKNKNGFDSDGGDAGDDWNEKMGSFLSNIRKPALKVLMVDEDSRTMHNASIWPAGSADGDGNTGSDFDGGDVMVMHNKKTNVSFVDGHVERMPSVKAWMIQQSIGSISANGVRRGLTQEQVTEATKDSKGATRPGNYYRDLYWFPYE